MKHIEEERLMELALTELEELSVEESSHLETCSECARLLAEERALTAAIERMPQISPPAGFAQRTAELFVKTAAREVKVAPWIVISLVAVTAIISLMMWMIIFNPSVFVSQAAMGVAKIATFFRAMALVLARVPFAHEIITTFSGAIVLISAALLSGILKRAEQVK